MRQLSLRALLGCALLTGIAGCDVPSNVDAPAPTAPRAEFASSTSTPLLMITEFMADPTKVGDTSGEWFEVFNPGATPVNMNGWRIRSGPTGSETHVIADDVIVPAGGYAVLGNNASFATNGGVTVSYQYPTAVTLNNSNTDWLLLRDAGDALVDSVSYSPRSGSTIVSPTFSPSGGRSRVVIDIAVDRTIASSANWRNAVNTEAYGAGDFGTPGTGPYGPAREVATLTLTPTSATLITGQSLQLVATAQDADGGSVAAAIEWLTSNASVVSVTTAGLAIANSAGSATITARAPNGVQATASLTVEAPVVELPPLFVTEFMADPSAVADASGEWVEVFNAGAEPVNLLGWILVSNNASERHVISQAVVVPARGYVVLGSDATAATNGGAPVAYDWGALTLANSGSTERFVLQMPDERGVDSLVYAPSFSPQSGTARARISIEVLDPAVGGSNWENATRTYGSGDRGTPGTGHYGSGPAAAVTVLDATTSIGRTRTLAADVVDAAGSPVRTTVTWSSDNTAVATINATTGAVTGVAVGTALITATTANGVSGTLQLTVTEFADVASLSININPAFQLPVTYEKPTFVTARDDSNATIPSGPLTWLSLTPLTGSVDQRGYFTGVAPGTGRWSATAASGVADTTFITVVPETAPTTADYTDALAFGTPTTQAGDQLVSKPQFVAAYSNVLGAPRWVAWTLNATHFGAADRCNCFSRDPVLPTADRISDWEYRGAGYDRGHMVQSESRTATIQDNAATFRMTNIVPQAGNTNQGPWLRFEEYLNAQAQAQGKEVYVVAGGEYAATPQSFADGRVLIPDYTWKVALIVTRGAGLGDVLTPLDARVVAVRMPNLLSTAPAMNSPWEPFETTVDVIEAATGLDVMAALPDLIEGVLESGDRRPTAVTAASYSSVEGSAVTLDASASSDPDAGDVLTYRWLVDGVELDGSVVTHTFRDDGARTATLIVTDRFGWADTTTAQVNVANAAPVITSVQTQLAGAAVGSAATVRIAYRDAGVDDTHEVTIEWGDGSTSTHAGSNGVVEASHSYAAAGLSTATLTLRDDDGGTATAPATFATYDPATSLTGEAGVRFAAGNATLAVSTRYLPNGTFASSTTLSGAGIQFTSASAQWLVVTGRTAVLRGTGTLDGQDGLTFELTVVDGERPGGRDDRVRLRVLDAAGNVLLDNVEGGVAGVTAPTAGGNLTIHR